MINLLQTQKIKEALQAAPQNAADIIETTAIGICITDENGNYAAVNQAYCRIYEFERQELIGKSFTVVVPQEHRQNMQILHRKFLRDKREIAREWTVLTKTGKAIRISVDAAYSDTILGGHPHKITFVQPE